MTTGSEGSARSRRTRRAVNPPIGGLVVAGGQVAQQRVGVLAGVGAGPTLTRQAASSTSTSAALSRPPGYRATPPDPHS